MRVDLIGRDCELEISEVLRLVDPRGDRIESSVGARYGHSPLLVGLSLGLRPMKTHNSNQEMKSN